VRELTKMSEELDFIIFEDRKFADIGVSCPALTL
jgi:orotidine-5'-phosphate decarboxylase